MQNTERNGASWNWLVDHQSGCLTLSLSQDIVFKTIFRAEELQGSESNFSFSTTDAFTYSLYRDKFRSLNLDEESEFSLAIFATIARHYLKPQATKSWYFKPSSEPQVGLIKEGDWVSAEGLHSAIYLVIGADENACDIMLVSKEHQLDGNRFLSRGKVLRVHRDRIAPVLFKIEESQL